MDRHKKFVQKYNGMVAIENNIYSSKSKISETEIWVCSDAKGIAI